MAVHKVNQLRLPGLALAAHASTDAVCPHVLLSSKPACCFLVMLYNYTISFKLSTVSLKMISPQGALVA